MPRGAPATPNASPLRAGCGNPRTPRYIDHAYMPWGLEYVSTTDVGLFVAPGGLVVVGCCSSKKHLVAGVGEILNHRLRGGERGSSLQTLGRGTLGGPFIKNPAGLSGLVSGYLAVEGVYEDYTRVM